MSFNEQLKRQINKNRGIKKAVDDVEIMESFGDLESIISRVSLNCSFLIDKISNAKNGDIDAMHDVLREIRQSVNNSINYDINDMLACSDIIERKLNEYDNSEWLIEDTIAHSERDIDTILDDEEEWRY